MGVDGLSFGNGGEMSLTLIAHCSKGVGRTPIEELTMNTTMTDLTLFTTDETQSIENAPRCY